VSAYHGPLKVALAALNQTGYQSLALGYVRAYAEAHERLRGKAAFQTLDLTVDVDPWWVAFRVLGIGPDVVGFSVYCWNARMVYEACRVIREASPDTVIVLGGPEVGPNAEEILADHPAVDAVVRDEGEVTFAELLHVIASGKRMHMVQGVTARDGAEIVSAPARPPIEDLDTIPSPYLTGLLAPVDGGAYLESYRGCPFQCGYCYEAKGVRRIRRFSEARIKAEIDLVASWPGMTNFSFIDSVFNLTDERLTWFAEAMAPHVRRGVRLHTIEVDIERVGPETVELLQRAGVASVETGPQTIGAEGLETSRRGFDRDRFIAGVVALKEAGITVECDLIAGLPGDTVHDFLAGLRFALDLDPGIVQTSTLHVLPGTDFWVRSEELGLKFDREPPHEVVMTAQAGYQDLRRAEVMSVAVQRAYRARV
jgi:radical SAM superfamily enzyme YgiQ (UPF0313 family)